MSIPRSFVRAFSASCRVEARKRALLGSRQLNRSVGAAQEDATFEAPPEAVESAVPQSATLPEPIQPFHPTKPFIEPAPRKDVPIALKPKSLGESPTCLYWDTSPPTRHQLDAAEYFFRRRDVKHIWTQAEFKKIPMSESPEVVVMGRSNVGKSSMLNGLFNTKGLARTSKHPGATKLFHAYSVCDGKMVVLDTPGYGFKSREEWGTQIMKYLTRRKQLRRTFILIDSEHGFKETDDAVVTSIASEGVPYQIVLSKTDKVPKAKMGKVLEDTKKKITNPKDVMSSTVLGEIIGVQASPKDTKIPRKGLNELRWAMIVACGLEEYAMDLRNKKGYRRRPEPRH